jgi:drug/metabolite transporter (DMT)-like permease
MAIFCNGFFYILSWVLFFEGARYIGTIRASMMACVEPLFAALLAVVFLSQVLSTVEWIGFFIVLSSIYLFEKFSSKHKQA